MNMPKVKWNPTMRRWNEIMEQQKLEIGRLEAVLAAHGVRKCHVCGGWEKPKSPLDGIGGIQFNDMGYDSDMKPTHVQCARKSKT